MRLRRAAYPAGSAREKFFEFVLLASLQKFWEDLLQFFQGPSAVTDPVLDLGLKLGHGLTAVRKVKDGIIAEAMAPLGSKGNLAPAFALDNFHFSPG